MLYKVLAFMKATTLKSLWVELTKTLIDKDGNRETDGITNKQTNKLPPRNGTRRRKPTVPPLLNKLPAFFGTQLFVTLFTEGLHLAQYPIISRMNPADFPTLFV